MSRPKVYKEPHIPPTLDERGHEVLDTTPVAIPVKFKGHKPGLTEEVQRAMMYLSYEASANEQETFEEADDFNVPGDNDFFSPHEIDEEQEAYDAARDERWIDGSKAPTGGGNGDAPKQLESGGTETPPSGKGPTTGQPTAPGLAPGPAKD